MHAIDDRAGFVEFPENLIDNGRPVNWLHLAVAGTLIGLTAYGLSAIVQLLSL